MPQSLTIQVGQCGNQIGSRFWDLALQEQLRFTTATTSSTNSNNDSSNESLETFFRESIMTASGSNRGSKGTRLRARAVLVDMEEGVLHQIKKGPVRKLFEQHQFIGGSGGSGNNWSVGYTVHGSAFQEEILESIRIEAEQCDSLQSMFLLQSLGGGTGSGLGSKIGELLADNYPSIYRVATTIMPSANDDVVTSPYNAILSLSKLIDNMDAIIPIENQALIDISLKASTLKESRLVNKQSVITQNGLNPLEKPSKTTPKQAPFDDMNNLVAQCILNLTSSMRFPGSLNVDFNDITTNLVPFPRLKFLTTSLSPLIAPVVASNVLFDPIFSEAFSPDNCLLKTDPRSGIYFACAVIARGKVEISDLRRNIDRIRPSLRFVPWNPDGWKTGICSFPTAHQTANMICLANNNGVAKPLSALRSRFMKLYQRKANLHHYTSNLETGFIAESARNVTTLISEYLKEW